MCRRDRSAVRSEPSAERPASSGRSPANAPTTSASVSAASERGVERREQEGDLVRARFRDVGDRPVHRFVRDADVHQPVGLRDREHVPVALARDRHDQRGGRVSEGPRAQDQVGAAGRPQPHGRVEVVRPYAGRVDHRPGPDLEPRTGDGVAHRGTAGVQVLDAAPGQDPGAVTGRGAGERDHQAGVVDELPVPLHDPAAQAGPPDGRQEPQHLGGADPARPRQRGGRSSGGDPQRVGGGESRAREQVAAGRHVRGQRMHERQRGDQVRRRPPEQDVALGGALVRQPEVPGGQVAQPAVYQLRTPPRGAEGQIVRVERGDRQAAGGGVEGHAGAGDAEADDEQIDEPAAGQVGQVTGAAVGRQGRLHGVRYRSRSSRRSASRSATPTSSAMVPAEITNPCVVRSTARASSAASAARTRAVGLTPPDVVGEPGEDAVLAGPAPVDQVGQQGLRIDVDDAPEHRVFAQRADRADHAVDDAVPDGVADGPLGGVDDQRGPLAGHQVAHQRAHVGPAAVHRHARHPGAAGDVGQRGAPQAHREDAVARGVQQRVVVLARPTDPTVTSRRHLSQCNP